MPKTRPVSQQRKRRVRISKAAPFPVPIATVTGETASNSNWIYYTATLQDSSVVVHHTGDMDFLYRMGFFGKGSMSRGQPQWSEYGRVAALPCTSPQGGGWQGLLHARVTSRRRYTTHLKWRLLSVGDLTTLDRLQQDQELIVDTPRQHSSQDLHEDLAPGLDIPEAEQDDAKTVDMEDEICKEMSPEVVVEHSTDADWGEGEGDADFWGTENNTDTSVSKKSGDNVSASWDTAEGDAAFWGTEDNSTQSILSSSIDNKTPCNQCGAGSVKSSPECESSSQTVSSTHKQNQTCTNCQTQGTGDVCAVGLTTASEMEGNNLDVQQSNTLNSVSREGAHITSKELDDSSSDNTTSRHSPTSDVTGVNVTSDINLAKETSLPLDEAVDVPCNSGIEKSSADCDASQNTLNHHNTENPADACGDASNEDAADDENPPVEWSEFCEDDEGMSPSDRGLLFVVADSDEEETRSDGQMCRTKTQWRPVVKPDPFPVQEHLHLGNEEAFFLSYGLGCLSVMDSQQTPLTLQSLWQEFCKRQPDFVPNYVAYHHYRSKNWVPKTGLKFGCTFLLYKDGPPFYHGSYSVVVKFVDTEGRPVEDYGKQRQFSWTSLAGLKRITEHVGKELMLCYVIKPRDMSPQDMLSPSCIPRFQVKEMLVSRWVSSQEREDKGLEEMP